jgi:hypothetical protein
VEDLAADLERALVDRRLLARYRRILVGLLLVLGTVIFAATRLQLPALRRPIGLVAVVWFSLWLPTFRALILEHKTQRLIDRLSASLQRSRP